MQKLLIAPALMLALSACVPQENVESLPPATGDSAEVYKAIGTEPGWLLEMDTEKIRYTGDYGETEITVETPTAMPSFNGMRYVTPQLTVDITYSQCNDGMSDRHYAHSVIVTEGETSVHGCGGNILPPENLDGTNWQITAINGTAPASPEKAKVEFSEGRISASVGCNGIGASYNADRNTLTTGPARSTRMACPGPLMEQESALMGFFEKDVTIRFTPEGNMLLTTGDRTLALERII